MARTQTIAYTEPTILPAGCVRVRWKGRGHTELTNWEGWRILLEENDTLIVKRETWDNITNPALPMNPRNWELVEE